MNMSAKAIFTFLVIAFFQEARPLTWDSDGVIPPNQVLYVCVGGNVSLPWHFTTSDTAEHLINVEWTADTLYHGQELIATYVQGRFLQVPIWDSTVQRYLLYVPNAGVFFYNATERDSGNYTVTVNANLHGSTIRQHRFTVLDVGDTDRHCPSNKEELRVLRQRYSQLQAEAERLRRDTSRLQDLVDTLQTPCNAALNDTGNATEARPTSCVSVRDAGGKSGVYTIYPDMATPINVYCNQESEGGGWAVIHRRFDGSVDFYRNWTDYEAGFGLLSHEFWLGLGKIHLLTASQNQSLRVEIQDFENVTAWALYKAFNISGPESNYTLYVEGYSGTAGDSMRGIGTSPSDDSQYMAFSTPDRDNDESTGSCSDSGHGAWWYKWCADANLNGKYGARGKASWSYMTWFGLHNNYRALKAATMMVRPA